MAEPAAHEIVAFLLDPPAAYVRPLEEASPAPGPELNWQLTGLAPNWAKGPLRPRLTGSAVATQTVPPVNSARPVLPKAFARPTFTEAATEAVSGRRDSPFASIGKLTARFSSAPEAVRERNCTAWVVAERVIATAAHCVLSPSNTTPDPASRLNLPARSVRFAPQFHGEAEAGVWIGLRAYTFAGYARPEAGASQSPFDIALVVLDRPLANQTGQLGVLARSVPEGPFLSVGYPLQPSAGWPFDGRFLYSSHGERVGLSRSVLEARNGLTEGSSGGPWFISYEGQPLVAGLNSTKPLGSDATTFSPVLEDQFLKLLSRVLADLTGV
jgi:hypothetical protein